ncbi:MAG: polysaccharide biosynthesis protein [Oscillospiraceae bacterium]|nr:polysaccharide biosynthesis protein [Oscillospiraceae bacterium]
MDTITYKGNREWKIRVAALMLLDAVNIFFSYLFALVLRFEFHLDAIPREFIDGFAQFLPVWILATVAVFWVCRLYHSIWSQVSVAELEMIVLTYVVLLPVYLLIIWIGGVKLPRSCYVMGIILNFCGTCVVRFGYRMARILVRQVGPGRDEKGKRIMVIGAGNAGQMVIKELHASVRIRGRVCCVIDDNPNKRNRIIEGVLIAGNRHDIVRLAEKCRITHIIFAIPTATAEERTAILNICKETGCKLQTIPGIYQLVNNEVSVTKLRDVDITDLLGREQVQVNNDEILDSIAGKVVLVTGGGGSIGSELCRQIAKAGPQKLVIFDIYENNAYAIQQELKRSHPELDMTALIGSVRNTNRINYVMRTYHPDIVFHAAAHKHVPLMEDSPNEAIKNNVIGTYKTAQAAACCGVKKFVLISTDKAVNPTNIMGASKRLCEMVVQMMDRQTPTTSFVAVRFGNVLGSNGSVIPLFKQQIAEGGPVTVTDKRIIRYFMTIPEAVSLVLQASYYAKGGEIFVLDMGDPVKIDDMARNLIRLSGYKPDVDIKIVYTGLRPGEKLFEELLMDEEGMKETENKLIHIGCPIEMDDGWFRAQLHELDEASKEESDRICELVSRIVPTYRYQKKKEEMYI